MSPSKRQRPTTGKGNKGQRPSAPKPTPVQRHRLGLLLFGVGFVVLFAAIGISEGIGDPSVPSGDIAVIEEAPGDLGKVTREKFDHALEQAAAEQELKTIPKPGDKQYDELKEAAVNALFETIWLQGLGEELGFDISGQEVAKELRKIKKQSFKSEAEFKKFMEKSRYTSADVNERVKLQILTTKIQQKLTEEAGQPSKDEIQSYYDAAKETQFTTPASRDIRMILNKDEKKAAEAKAALEKDDSKKNWEKVAKKYSEDTATKELGGLQSAVTAESGRFPENLETAIFAAPKDKLEGPIQTPSGYYVFAVEKEAAETVQPLKAVESQISAQLAQQNQSTFFEDFIADDFNAKWLDRTFCASGYETERCANFKSDGHPATADPACYEANPKKAPEACPAPVFQLQPATPGSVTFLEPKGKQLPQRPRPAGEEIESGAATELPPGLEIPGAE